MNNIVSRLYFASDYMEGAHPAIMQKLVETNLEKTVGYGLDPYTESAKEKIRTAVMHQMQMYFCWWVERRRMQR